jgi:uncharacterized protein
VDRIIENCLGFQWDQGNSDKNWEKHKVSKSECEQAFFNIPIVIADDTKHSIDENRWYILGRTDTDRLLFIVFTIREKLIRVISARNMNKKEREIYNEQIKKYSEL